MSASVLALAFAFAFSVASAPAHANDRGMTWALSSHEDTYGVDLVSCHGGDRSCDAYRGDTSCGRKLPVLCIYDGDATNPGVSTSTYGQWAGGNIATTLPVAGWSMGSLEAADAICAESFGADWRMAEFHDGWGWGFTALGAVRSDTRFWVYIDDQRANCWD